MADISNTSGTSDLSYNNGISTKRPTKKLFKPPFDPDSPIQEDTLSAHPYQANADTIVGPVNKDTLPVGHSNQRVLQAPPLAFADIQKTANNFLSTEPVVNLNFREERSRIDTLKNVALSSKNSLQISIAAARLQQPMIMSMPAATYANTYPNPFPDRRESGSVALNSAMLLPNVVQRPSRVPMAQRELPPHSTRTKFLLLIFLLGYLIPAIIGISDSLNLYAIYSHGYHGVQHLLHVRTIANDLKAHPTSLDLNKLHQVQAELEAARGDFKALRGDLMQNVYVDALNSSFPRYVASALALCQIGTDASDIGQALAKLVISAAPSLHGSLLAKSTQPFITPSMLPQIRSTIEYILPLMKDIQAQTPSLSLDIFPISATQRVQITQAIQLLPLAITDLTQAHDMVDAIGWILGVGQTRTFLIQTVDRAELRPTGGFTGQFSELSLNGGRMGPVSLQNIGIYEENKSNAPNVGKSPPASYASWWPIANWGLRDSNLSADFPTSVRIAINVYKREFHHQVDGIVVFAPSLIAQVLAATGPIYVPEYKETITVQNLESKLHYYQLDNVGIRKEEIVEHVENPDIARKLFTKRVSQLLMNKVRHASINDLIGIAHEMLRALQTRDLQVYVTNAQIENLLIKHDGAALMNRSTTHDGLFVVQANVSANKGSQYVRTIMNDTVTLDANGGATHSLQIHLAYQVLDQIYGPDTYHDYVRVYVPPTSTFLGGNGFEQLGHPLCSAPAGLKACSTYDAYGDGNLLCPANQSDPMVETNQINDPYIGLNHPLNQEGPPTNVTSDEPQRNMYAGWVLIPKNCTATLELSWYVPPMGHNAYSLLVQRQSSTYPEMNLTILPTPENCAALKTTGKYFDTILSRDQLFSLPTLTTGNGAKVTCYVQPKL